MKINDTIINADCETVIAELQRQLAINNILYLQRTINGASNIQVQCPFHGNGQERHPSAGIRKSDGVFHCFSCDARHTLPEVISYCFGQNDMLGRWGMRWLLRNFSATSIEERKDVEIDFERNTSAHKDSSVDSSDTDKPISVVSEEELDSYRYYHEYWTERGITNDDIIELFDLGYDIDTNCITFPNRDINGNCVFVARRNVKTKWFNYPKDVEKPLYGLYELTYTGLIHYADKVYITESMIDCLLLWQSGKYAVALNGLGSEEQIKILQQLSIRQYVLATDNDKRGLEARDRLRNALSNKLITEIDFPRYRKDIGECTRREIDNIDKWEVF